MTHFKSDASTLGLSGTGRLRTIPRGKSSPASIPTLTLLYHPDLRRVGERALLSELTLGREARLGRHEPEFSTPESAMGEPLNDRHISRQPLHLRPAPQGGIVLAAGESRTRVVADGVLLAGELAIPAAELVRGVVLELADRVVLLLHVLDHLTAPAAETVRAGGRQQRHRPRARSRSPAWPTSTSPCCCAARRGPARSWRRGRSTTPAARRDGPFVAVNLGAIPPTLVASELFGAARGAYTGSVQAAGGVLPQGPRRHPAARRGRRGDPRGAGDAAADAGDRRGPSGRHPEPAAGGRARARRHRRRPRSARRPRGSSARPLLHRLAGYEIWLPPLRERRDDIGRLLIHFLRRELAALGEARPPGPRRPASLWLPPGIVARLARYDWPGNVRQLRNVARQIAIGSRGLPRAEIGPAVERLLRERRLVDPAGR